MGIKDLKMLKLVLLISITIFLIYTSRIEAMSIVKSYHRNLSVFMKSTGNTEVHWAKKYHTELSEMGIYSTKTLKDKNLNSYITIEEFSECFIRIMEKSRRQEEYVDADYMKKAVDNGFIHELDIREPDNQIQRIEVIKMMVNGLKMRGEALADLNCETRFRDDGLLSIIERGYVKIALELGLVSGYPDGSLLPYERVTYGEVSSFLIRMKDLIESFSDEQEV